MKLAVITPCIYPNMFPIHYLLQSCQNHGVPIQTYGVGKQYADWRNMLEHHTIPHMNNLVQDGYTHVLYVDGIDSLFVAGLTEVATKYTRAGSPTILMSADSDPPRGLVQDKFYLLGPWKYLNAGGYIGSIPHIIKMWKQLSEDFPDEGNYQRWLEISYPSPHPLYLDVGCEIFQPMDGNTSVMPMGRRVLNTITNSWPCILHFRGGYCDPKTGRDERMKPWVDALSMK